MLAKQGSADTSSASKVKVESIPACPSDFKQPGTGSVLLKSSLNSSDFPSIKERASDSEQEGGLNGNGGGSSDD